MNNNNFLWLIDDINDSFRIKLFYHDKDGNKRYATYIGKDINRLDNSKIELEDGNIEALDSVIGGMVRFVNEMDDKLILDIPMRNLYMLVNNSDEHSKEISVDELHGFSPVDIDVMEVYYFNQVSDELKEVMEISRDYYGATMQDGYNYMKRFNEINNYRKEEYNSYKR